MLTITKPLHPATQASAPLVELPAERDDDRDHNADDSDDWNSDQTSSWVA